MSVECPQREARRGFVGKGARQTGSTVCYMALGVGDRSATECFGMDGGVVCRSLSIFVSI